MSAIDGATNSGTATISVGTQPLAIAMNPATNRVYIADTQDNTVAVIDGNKNDAGVPEGIGLDLSLIRLRGQNDEITHSFKGPGTSDHRHPGRDSAKLGGNRRHVRLHADCVEHVYPRRGYTSRFSRTAVWFVHWRRRTRWLHRAGRLDGLLGRIRARRWPGLRSPPSR
ncbi:MAG: YncE family protein [Bryobacteraceae bacterium]